MTSKSWAIVCLLGIIGFVNILYSLPMPGGPLHVVAFGAYSAVLFFAIIRLVIIICKRD